MFNAHERFFVGFEPIIKKINEATEQSLKASGIQNWPPYNIKKIDENKYTIEMAVAGFTRQDIEIELDGSNLIVKGQIPIIDQAEQDSTGTWTWPTVLYQGLAMRPFTRKFTLADNVEVKNAEMINGILKIVLEVLIPEEKKPVKIEIKEGN